MPKVAQMPKVTQMPKVVCISQARMTSTRLPGKVMLPVAGKPLLAWHLERLQRARLPAVVAVASVAAPESAPIVALCRELGVPVTLGPEDDVLARYHRCADEHQAEVVVRVTSDCPLIDPALVDRAVACFLAGNVDYLALDTTVFPRGLDVEVFSRAGLDEAFARAVERPEREHVTPYLYHRPERFRVVRLGGGRGGAFRLCVDQSEDLDLVRAVMADLAGGGDFGWQEVVALLEARPDLAALNAEVRQKTDHLAPPKAPLKMG